MAHGHSHKPATPAVQEHTFHVHPPFLYIKTLGALLVLMLLTIGVAEIHIPDLHLGGFTIHGTLINNIVAMAIAVTKALLVLMFFMGLKFATKLTKLWAVSGFVGFILMFLMFGDYSTRKYEPINRWTEDPGSAMMRTPSESRLHEEKEVQPGMSSTNESEEPNAKPPQEH